MRVEFTIPGPPRSWKRRRVGHDKTTGRILSFNDPKYEKNKAEVGWQLLRAIGPGRQGWWQRQRIRLTLTMWFPTHRTQDADRVLNLVLDAGKGVVWKDDTWVTFEDGEIVLRPRLDSANPRTEVVLEAIGERR